VSRLYVTGCLTELCVDTTCRRAIGLGFATTLVADGHTTEDVAVAGVGPAQRIRLTNFALARVATADWAITVVPSLRLDFAASAVAAIRLR
jgi:nicotinamidase-related amidase